MIRSRNRWIGLGAFRDEVLFEFSHEGLLLGASLEATMAELGAGVDPLQVDLLIRESLGLVDETLTQRDWTLLGAHATTANHQIVLVDQSVVRETSHWIDVLDSDINLSSGVLLAFRGQGRLSDTVDLLVDFCSMMVSFLTGSSDCELDSRWMPSADTSNLSKSFVGLSRKFLAVPTTGDSLEALALGYTDHVDHLVLREDLFDRELLFEVFSSPVHFVSD